MDTKGFLLQTRLEVEVLESWIAAGWVLPRQDSETHRFSEVDVARAQLIRELTQDMGVNAEGVAIILELVDQIHGLRCALRDVQSALGAQPEAVRREILAAIRDTASIPTGDGSRADENPCR
jgi:chaperone modulatory protein CbpM